MTGEVRLSSIIWHSSLRLVFSIRGLIALLFSIAMISMIAFVFDKLPPAFFEILRLFTTDPALQFQWLLFDNALSKLITLFIAPIFIFDAISGDRGDDRLGLMLSRPISRTRFLLVKLLSSTLAFGIIFLPVMVLAYPVFTANILALGPVTYFATSLLVFLLAFFAMSVGLLVSTITKRSIVSFIAMFGLMTFLMLPNASKYTSDEMNSLAMATPHYYATYFTSHAFDVASCIVYAVVILLFSLPTLIVTILKFGREDL